MRLRLPAAIALPAVALLTFAAPAFAVTTQHFESPHVHPVEMSPDGTKLFAVHTAGHELTVFDLTGPAGPVRTGKVEVGYEPVTVRARNNNEVWVVSHISHAINIIDVATLSVTRTLLPGHQPTDVAFVEGQSRAFVSCSEDDQVVVYDLANLDLPPTAIPLDHADPRSLALSPDGSTLYVSALDSQNETTVVPYQSVAQRGGRPAPNPPMDPALPPEFATSLIVRHDGIGWKDEADTTWNVPYTLFDRDVIAIDTATLNTTTSYRGVGTTLFNLAVNPVTGMVYVSNQEASNEVRFEENLFGQFVKTRITLIDPVGSTVTPVSLNPHINYAVPAGNPAERALSLAYPLDMAVSSDGTQIYVAAMSSRR
ncbi:MAG: hypothetical protein HKN12_12340, partial [Gemmatimonadetes bacterium]|nr:hypothetical protein [Gemmatimonadota bacterium]